MLETPVSLLERVRLYPNPQSWHQLIDLYTPLVRSWLRRYPLQSADVEDVVQEVMAVLVRELPHFRHDLRTGAFRRWLRTILLNRLRTFWRARRARPLTPGNSDFEHMLQELEDPNGPLSRLWEEEHDRQVTRRLLEMLRPEFEATTWQAFQRLVLEERPTAEVAAELGLTVKAVRIAKSRVLRRLRQEIQGLVD